MTGIEIPDLTNLPITSVVAFALLVAAVDVLTSVVAAIARGVFDTHELLTFIRTHVLLRVFPITVLGLFGAGVAAVGIPPIPAAGLATTAALGLYIVETLGSLNDLRTSSEPPKV